MVLELLELAVHFWFSKRQIEKSKGKGISSVVRETWEISSRWF
jgi:hypothetical protein